MGPGGGAGPLDGAIVLWFVLVTLSTLFVAIDIRTTPEALVMKVGFVVVTLYSGPFGALLYVLSCREPMPRTHEAFVSARWRQVVGSTMHCVAGDGIGILAAAALTNLLHLPMGLDLVVEYFAGFVFGWTIFQALFMKGLMGGSYLQSLRSTFLPEFLSMNGVMAGMTAVMVPWMSRDAAAMDLTSPHFWFVMSIALSVGFVVAFPINWWLVSRGLKHGMMTVRADDSPTPQASGLALAGRAMGGDSRANAGMDHGASATSARDLAGITLASLALLAVGLFVAGTLGSLTMRSGSRVSAAGARPSRTVVVQASDDLRSTPGTVRPRSALQI
ncbi:MAG: hypothetical protein NVSMB17_00010 [Candidatus Dormibacteria bacterium]